MTVFKNRLGQLNYEVKDLDPMDLIDGVPDDATVVIVLAPTFRCSRPSGTRSRSYLDKGGRLMIAIDPKADPSLGSLEGKLGVKYNPVPISPTTRRTCGSAARRRSDGSSRPPSSPRTRRRRRCRARSTGPRARSSPARSRTRRWSARRAEEDRHDPLDGFGVPRFRVLMARATTTSTPAPRSASATTSQRRLKDRS